MIVPTLFGALTALLAAVLRLLKGRPGREEIEMFALALVLAFINGFMIVYLALFAPAFAFRLTFHLVFYALLASLTAVFYACYKASMNLKVYVVAMTPWFILLVLIIAARLLGSVVLFLW